MELVAGAETRTWSLPQRLWSRLDRPALSAWTLAFALVTYLALRDGGYDTIVRSEVGIAIWWIVLLAALAGILPARIGAAGWIPIGLLGAFAVWTGLATGWSENSEASLIELGRIATYFGVLVLAVALQGRTAARHTINGLACAIGFVTLLAVLSRLHPQAFPANQHFEFLGAQSDRRLSYPLNYWNGLAAFAAMGVPLLLAVAIGARTMVGRAVATATLPLSVLCIYMTVSRGGVLELAAGLVVFIVLVPRRLEALARLALVAAASAILVWAASKRAALATGIPTPGAIHEGTQLVWIAVIVCTGVALIGLAFALAERHLPRPASLAPSRRRTAQIALAVLAVGIVVAVAAGVPSELARDWHDFKQPTGAIVPRGDNTVFERLSAVNGNGRYQYWQAAVHAFQSNPLGGIGPGTFQYWWAQHATSSGFVRNAHSLYFETLAETGIVGFALLIGLFVACVAVAVRRALRSGPELRLWLASATAGLATFLFAAAIDWVWQLAAIACAALVLGAVMVSGRSEPAPTTEPVDPPRFRSRLVLGVLAVAAISAIAVPLAEQLAIRQSQTAAQNGNLAGALKDSITAQSVDPDAATPHLQEALVLEASGRLAEAAIQARIATRDGPTDWSNWLTLARIEAREGELRTALATFQRARHLNPRSTLFTET